jgi:hypothetical protein
VPGPVIIGGLAPDAAGRLDADQCRLCDDDQGSCETAWQRNHVGLPLSCYFNGATGDCRPCVADES